MDAGLGSWAPHDTHRLARPLARAGVGLGSLSPHRQTAQVTDATIRFDALQSFEIHTDLSAQIAFNDILAILNGVNDLRELLLGQILGANARINICLGQDDFCVAGADAVDVAECNVDPFARRDFHTNNSSHIFLNKFNKLPRRRSTLPLLVAGVGADYPDDAFAANNFAILAELLNRCADFHI